MKQVLLAISFFFLVFIHIKENEAREEAIKRNELYIVYMGGPNQHSPNLLISNLLKRNKNAIVHRYKNGFTGFAARFSKYEAEKMAKQPGVVSVFPDPILKLHTTHSWDFLLLESAVEIQSSPSPSPPSDTIVGILDTGIWPESASFDDKDMGEIPSKWTGICMAGNNFTSSNCNRKLIGARYYTSSDPDSHTPRDSIGHGTHVASTITGARVSNASYYGLAAGTAKGGSPASRVAMYRVCSDYGCRGSAILAAFDDAIADGVDVLSLSLGASPSASPPFSADPIAIGAFHAVQKGITVVCSAGNDGPFPSTVVNVAPWILTVGATIRADPENSEAQHAPHSGPALATTIDRDFETDVVLDNGKVFKGKGINLANTDKSPIYPMISGESAKNDNNTSSDEARQCLPGGLDAKKTKGKIVVCEGQYGMISKVEEVKSKGGVGIVLVILNDMDGSIASEVGSFAFAVVSSDQGAEILSYINSTSNPLGTVQATNTVTNYKPAPVIASFSARGPSTGIENILKPDIAAPGVNILAAWLGDDASISLPGRDPAQYYVISGTSMSCPHVSGVAAAIKSRHPSWSPAAIRSAIMTTAIQTNNMKSPITTHTGESATPYDFGSGELNPFGALNPGLVYDLDSDDYTQFLCFYGYNTSQIKLLKPSLPDAFACPKDSNTDMIMNINYPSIAVHKDVSVTPVNVTRTLTNVGDGDDAVYNVTVAAPKGLVVEVEPEVLKFSVSDTKLSYRVTFSSSSSTVPQPAFGTITWSNGKYKVSSPFVVSAPSKNVRKIS